MLKQIILLLVTVAGTFAVVSPVAAQSQGSIPEPTQRTDVPFRLFKTQNIYTFLKLDTRTGLVWQVQWGEEAGYRWVAAINLKPLADGKENGRFTLCPSSNIYTFVLLDQLNGRVWQVQWGTDKDHRFLVPIGPDLE